MTSYNTIETPQDYVNYTFNISSRGVTEVMGEMAGLSNTVTTILGQLAFKTSEYLTHTESMVIGMSTAAIAAYSSATQEAIKFEQQVANVQAIGGESINAMEIGQAAMQYSSQFAMDVNSMTEGLEALARAGLTATDVMSGVLAEGVKLSKLEGIDLEDSINDLIATTNLLAEGDLDINSREYAEAVKAMNQHIVSTSESAPINAENIIQSLQHVGGYASANKIDQDDLFAVIAQLGAKGTKGEMAGTALRAFVAAGQKDQAQRALARVGLNVSDLWDETGEAMLPISEMKDVIDNALEARGYSKQEKLEFYSDFAGYKQANQIMKIDTAEVQEYKKTIENAWDLGTKLDTILGTTQANLQTLFQTVKNFMTRVGSTMLPILNAIIIPIKWGVQLLDAIPFSENITGIFLAVTALKGILLFINRVVPTLASMYTSFSGATSDAEKNTGKIRGHISGIVGDLQQAKHILTKIGDKRVLSDIRLQQGLMGEQSYQVHKEVTKKVYEKLVKNDPNQADFDDLSYTDKEVLFNIMEAYKDTQMYQDELKIVTNRFSTMGEMIGKKIFPDSSQTKTSKSVPFNESNREKNDNISQQKEAFRFATDKIYDLEKAITNGDIKISLENDRQNDIGNAIIGVKDALADAIGRAVAQSLRTKDVAISEGLGSFKIDGSKASNIKDQLRKIEDNVSDNLGDIGYFLDYDLDKINNLLSNVGYDLQKKITAYSNNDVEYANAMQKTRMEKIISGAAKTNLGRLYSEEQNSIDILNVLRNKQWNNPGDNSYLGIHDRQMSAMESALGMKEQKGLGRTERLNNIHDWLQSHYSGETKEAKIQEILQETGQIWAEDISGAAPSREASKYLTDTRAAFIGNALDLGGISWNEIENPAQALIDYFADTQENTQKMTELKQADSLMFKLMEQAKGDNDVFNQSEADELGYLIRRYKQLILARNKLLAQQNNSLLNYDIEFLSALSPDEFQEFLSNPKKFSNWIETTPGAIGNNNALEDEKKQLNEEINQLHNDLETFKTSKVMVEDIQGQLDAKYDRLDEINQELSAPKQNDTTIDILLNIDKNVTEILKELQENVSETVINNIYNEFNTLNLHMGYISQGLFRLTDNIQQETQLLIEPEYIDIKGEVIHSTINNAIISINDAHVYEPSTQQYSDDILLFLSQKYGVQYRTGEPGPTQLYKDIYKDFDNQEPLNNSILLLESSLQDLLSLPIGSVLERGFILLDTLQDKTDIFTQKNQLMLPEGSRFENPYPNFSIDYLSMKGLESYAFQFLQSVLWFSYSLSLLTDTFTQASTIIQYDVEDFSLLNRIEKEVIPLPAANNNNIKAFSLWDENNQEVQIKTPRDAKDAIYGRRGKTPLDITEEDLKRLGLEDEIPYWKQGYDAILRQTQKIPVNRQNFAKFAYRQIFPQAKNIFTSKEAQDAVYGRRGKSPLDITEADLKRLGLEDEIPYWKQGRTAIMRQMGAQLTELNNIIYNTGFIEDDELNNIISIVEQSNKSEILQNKTQELEELNNQIYNNMDYFVDNIRFIVRGMDAINLMAEKMRQKNSNDIIEINAQPVNKVNIKTVDNMTPSDMFITQQNMDAIAEANIEAYNQLQNEQTIEMEKAIAQQQQSIYDYNHDKFVLDRAESSIKNQEYEDNFNKFLRNRIIESNKNLTDLIKQEYAQIYAENPVLADYLLDVVRKRTTEDKNIKNQIAHWQAENEKQNREDFLNLIAFAQPQPKPLSSLEEDRKKAQEINNKRSFRAEYVQYYLDEQKLIEKNQQSINEQIQQQYEQLQKDKENQKEALEIAKELGPQLSEVHQHMIDIHKERLEQLEYEKEMQDMIDKGQQDSLYARGVGVGVTTEYTEKMLAEEAKKYEHMRRSYGVNPEYEKQKREKELESIRKEIDATNKTWDSSKKRLESVAGFIDIAQSKVDAFVEIFPPLQLISAPIGIVSNKVKALTEVFDIIQEGIGTARVLNSDMTQEEAEAMGLGQEYKNAQWLKGIFGKDNEMLYAFFDGMGMNLSAIFDIGKRLMKLIATAIGQFIAQNIMLILPPLAIIGAAVGALYLSEQNHAKALKEATEEQEKAQKEADSSFLQYKNLRDARRAETDEIKRQQLARKESIALYQLEADRIKQLNAINKETELRNDPLWGEYGERARLQKMGWLESIFADGIPFVGTIGKWLAGDFQSQAENYDGTTKQIRLLKESSLTNDHGLLGNLATSYVGRWYDANKMQLGQIEAFGPELQELYDIESKLIEKYGSIEAARDSEEFKKAVQEFADATGINRETAEKYLDYLQTEHNVELATDVMQAQISQITAKAYAKVAENEYGSMANMGDMDNLQNAMIFASFNEIWKNAYNDMYWGMLMEYLQAIISMLMGPVGWGDALKHIKNASAYGDAQIELLRKGNDIYQSGVDIAEENQRRDYGHQSYSYYDDTPFGGALASSAAQEQDWALEALYGAYGNFYNASKANGEASAEGFKEGLDQHSPGKIARSMQAEMMFSKEAIKKGGPSVMKSLYDLSDATSSIFKGGSWVGQTILDGFSNGVNSVFDGFGKIFDKKQNNIKIDNSKTEIHIHNLNINVEDDPDKIKTAFMDLMVELGDQVTPRQVSRTIGGESIQTEEASQTNTETDTDSATQNTQNNNTSTN